MSQPLFDKIVLTGAAGRLGSYLREPLAALARTLVSTDLNGLPESAPLYPNETFHQADLADYAAVSALVEGAEIIVHFGAIVDDGPFNELLGPNFIGSYNIWEAGHRTGTRRIVYASSIHAVGMYKTTQCIDADVPHRPDSFYGLSKCFTEDLARMYYEKRGLEAVCLRIASCADVNNTRMLSTWLSYRDLIQLVTRACDSPYVGFTVAYGVSNNDRAGLDNSKVRLLGYCPQDNAEVYAAEMLAKSPRADITDAAQTCLGGPFASNPLGQGIIANMGIKGSSK